MSEELNHKTLDLASVFAGINYPTHEVPIYLNEALGFAIHVLREGLTLAEQRGDDKEAEDFKKQLDEAVEKAASSRYVVTLQGIPESQRQGILEKVMKEYPTKTDIFGREETNLERDRYYTRLLWTAMIKSISDAEGASLAVGEAEVAQLLQFAPASAHEAIREGIAVLSSGAKAGFEYATKEVDFLSTASHEG